MQQLADVYRQDVQERQAVASGLAGAVMAVMLNVKIKVKMIRMSKRICCNLLP